MAEIPGDEVRVEDLELGRLYYVRQYPKSELKKITIKYKERKEYYTFDNRYFVGDWVWSTKLDAYMKDKRELWPKFYKVNGEMYKENAARKILPYMMTYSARPPGTMSEENTGGRLYKLWEKQFYSAHPNVKRPNTTRTVNKKNISNTKSVPTRNVSKCSGSSCSIMGGSRRRTRRRR